jgi:hypothetical protein
MISRSERTFDVSPSLLGSICNYFPKLQEPLKVDVGVLCLVRPRKGIVEDEWLIQERKCSVGCLGPSGGTCFGEFESVWE